MDQNAAKDFGSRAPHTIVGTVHHHRARQRGATLAVLGPGADIMLSMLAAAYGGR